MNKRMTYLLCVSALTALISGCQTRLDAPFVDEGTFASLETRFSQDVIAWNPQLSSAQRYVPVHPGDGGPGLGGVSLDLDGVAGANRFGLAGEVGNQWIRLKLGTDLRFNYSDDDDDEIDDFDDDGDIEFESNSMRDLERQPLPSNFDSYGYAWIDTGDYSVIPYVGVEMEFSNMIVMSLEAGVPRTKFRFEKGHYRSGVTEVIERDVWEGYGQSLGATLGTRLLDNRGFLGLQYSYEVYDADFSGVDTDIQAHVVGLMFSLRF